MARADAFQVEGVVVEVLPRMICRVELANGHRVLAYGAARAGLASLAVRDKVMLELLPYDLSEGRVIGKTKKVEA
jgi:translation initiation factor IF-1